MGIPKTIFNMQQLLRTVIIVASFFLVFLGLRNPYLNGNPAPKQRPRAILEKIIKASDSIVQSILVQAEMNDVLDLNVRLFICYSIPTPFSLKASFPAQFARIARAPPQTPAG